MSVVLDLFGGGLLILVVGTLLGFGGAIGFQLAVMLSDALGARLGR